CSTARSNSATSRFRSSIKRFCACLNNGDWITTWRSACVGANRLNNPSGLNRRLLKRMALASFARASRICSSIRSRSVMSIDSSSDEPDFDVPCDLQVNGLLQCPALEIAQDLLQFGNTRLVQDKDVRGARVQRWSAIRHTEDALYVPRGRPA